MSTLREAEKELLKGKKREVHFALTSHSPRAWPNTSGGVKKKKQKKKGKGKASKASVKPNDKSQDV